MINHKRKNIDEFPISETVCDNTKIMKSSNNSNWNQCPTNKILPLMDPDYKSLDIHSLLKTYHSEHYNG